MTVISKERIRETIIAITARSVFHDVSKYKTDEALIQHWNASALDVYIIAMDTSAKFGVELDIDQKNVTKICIDDIVEQVVSKINK